MDLSADFINYLMDEALLEAQAASKAGEVPVGAVVAVGGKIISRAHNLVEANRSISNHAEVLALEAAAHKLDNWRLNEATLCVTIEPCTMCTGAIKLSRVKNLIVGAMDPSMGACGSIYDLSQDKRAGTVPRVVYGIKEVECGKLMQDFFAARRER